ncbi:hypothetical protein Scep_027732 [Stephania cephalantha]|uniref:Uncharacterized protein n=1 Tax=Stephania cephalantha TaxID=152367 RepID=A0AAP0HMT6_9MAGN
MLMVEKRIRGEFGKERETTERSRTGRGEGSGDDGCRCSGGGSGKAAAGGDCAILVSGCAGEAETAGQQRGRGTRGQQPAAAASGVAAGLRGGDDGAAPAMRRTDRCGEEARLAETADGEIGAAQQRLRRLDDAVQRQRATHRGARGRRRKASKPAAAAVAAELAATAAWVDQQARGGGCAAVRRGSLRDCAVEMRSSGGRRARAAAAAGGGAGVAGGGDGGAGARQRWRRAADDDVGAQRSASLRRRQRGEQRDERCRADRSVKSTNVDDAIEVRLYAGNQVKGSGCFNRKDLCAPIRVVSGPAGTCRLAGPYKVKGSGALTERIMGVCRTV